MREFLLFIVLSLLVPVAPLRALAQTDPTTERASDPRDSTCWMIESAARANALPVEFFARLIWQESHFQPDVVGPVTFTGARAQGIAQFMPNTAVERGLVDPFNPAFALPKSGEFLAELRDHFGNLGLAAAAYNSGPRRVREFLSGSRGLPLQTRSYVLAVTGRSVEDWAKVATETLNEEKKDEREVDGPALHCRDLIPILRQARALLVVELPDRKVPKWCAHVRHPRIDVCGAIRDEERTIITATLSKLRGRATVLRATSHE